MEEAQQDIREIQTLLRGELKEGVEGGGLIHYFQRISREIWGDRENPGGLVKDMADVKAFQKAVELRVAKLMGLFTGINAILVLVGPPLIKWLMAKP